MRTIIFIAFIHLFLSKSICLGSSIKIPTLTVDSSSKNNTNININSKITNKNIKDVLSKIETLEPSTYITNINKLRDKVEKFIEQKKHICSGEFSTIILDDNGVTAGEDKVKLNKNEKKHCFKELGNIQTIFINKMFIARKNFFKYLYINRVKELEKTRTMALNGLKKLLKTHYPK